MVFQTLQWQPTLPLDSQTTTSSRRNSESKSLTLSTSTPKGESTGNNGRTQTGSKGQEEAEVWEINSNATIDLTAFLPHLIGHTTSLLDSSQFDTVFGSTILCFLATSPFSYPQTEYRMDFNPNSNGGKPLTVDSQDLLQDSMLLNCRI